MVIMRTKITRMQLAGDSLPILYQFFTKREYSDPGWIPFTCHLHSQPVWGHCIRLLQFTNILVKTSDSLVMASVSMPGLFLVQ